MKKTSLFDDVSRLLASSISRRQAFEYLSILIGSTAFGLLPAKPARGSQEIMCGNVKDCIDGLDEFRDTCNSAKICSGLAVGTVVTNNGRSCVCVAQCWNYPDFTEACCTCLREDGV